MVTNEQHATYKKGGILKKAKTIRALCLSSYIAGLLFCNNLIAVESHQPKDQAEVLGEPLIGSSGAEYNPSLCKRDAGGMVYFAAGRTVFRVPYEKLLYIRGMGDQERATLPKRTDPSEQEGCPDNPLWGGSFRVQFDYAASLPSERASKNTGALTVNIVARPLETQGDMIVQILSLITSDLSLKGLVTKRFLDL